MSGTVSFAPVGTSRHDKAAWTTLPVRPGSFITFDESHDFAEADLKPYLDAINRSIANMKRAADGYSVKQGTWMTGDGGGWVEKEARDHYSFPQRCVIGVDPAAWDASIINERSKPMGLTKDHEYTDSDGDTIKVNKPHNDPEGTVAHVVTGDDGNGFYAAAATSVPLALNILGHDRPELGARRFPSDAQSYSPVVRSDGHRDEMLAEAVANLRAIDLYDQHLVKKKAGDEAAAKAAEIAAAKARVEIANREIAERHLRKAKDAYNNAIIDAYRWGVSPAATATLQSALSAYETARRKVEGLPN